MLGRLVHKADFERALRTAPLSRSAHFAVHHVPANARPARQSSRVSATHQLSTDVPIASQTAVDKNSAPILGTAIPKRYARAAVMRNVLKRLIRYVATRHAAALGSGVWLVRLLAPFSRTEFRSADSARLRQAVLQELDRLFSGALAVSQHPVRP